MTKSTTHSKTKKQLVPELRFKEFEETWIKEKAGELCECIVPGRNKPKEFDGGISWVTTPDITHNSYIFNSKSGLGISKEEAKSVGSKIVPKNSVIISCVGDLGLVAIAGNELVINQQLHAFLPSHKVEYRFLMYSITTQGKYMDKVATKTAVPYMNKNNCNSIPIYLPSLPEQKKIASFLSAIDQKIQQLTKKKTLLEQYKKGVMRQLFHSTSSRQVSGELRFKDVDGREYPDWEYRLFEDLYSFHSTNSLSRDKLNYKSGEIYNIHYGDIHTKFKAAFKLKNEYVPFVNQDVDLSKIKTNSYCRIGDLVMADASEDYDDIGKTIELLDLNDKKILAGLHTFLARPLTKETSIGFFSYLLKSWSMRKQIMVIAQGTKVLSLSTGRVAKLKLNLPIIEEQQKIAKYLSRIDNKIEAIADQITQTQKFKRGLLQKMFI